MAAMNRLGCSEFQRTLLNRRSFLKAGALGFAAGGLSLTDVLRGEAANNGATRKNNVIIL